jgi:hypothetical protein
MQAESLGRRPRRVRAPVGRCPPKKQRSAKTNGKRSLLDGNLTSLWGRRWRDLYNIFTADD